MSLSTSLYCTDEDLCIAAPGDFGQLIPLAQTVAKGTDGVFAASSNGSWTLISASCNFAGQSVSAGAILQIRGPQSAYPATDFLAVDSVTGSLVTLRRPGLPTGMGNPPGPAAGVNAVQFMIGTLYPQIERASYDIRKTFDLDDAVPGRKFDDMYDPRELQEACIALVLARQYRDMARHVGKMEDFYEKSKNHQADYTRIIQRTQIHMKNNHPGGDKLMRTPRLSR
ncbi:hypothetical protein UFOVP124_38 [uncultured Caudovirales phage]|uniref:Uncharacterized protein n=1 Tax=uncultured Caudovirales phage TaxID=2100421 RepID=A0A6J5L8M8_9CAUD|nr:hypothetical protein UFOVP124_38 [uncultured Caudovirales phage]